jgi:flavin reductase (DIM6/NTAB) family NADH-FMN oxidoreductase RutF
MRVPVELHRSYRLLNHGPVVLVTSSAGGRTNVMPAAWVMPVDFAPPLLAAVIAEDTFTRELVEASGELALSIPPASMLDAVHGAGQVSGRAVDKWARFGLSPVAASRVAAPLVDGCLGWLECRVVERSLAERLDLFVCEAVAAWADDAVFRDGEWWFAEGQRRTVHHVAAGRFFLTGEARTARASREEG